MAYIGIFSKTYSGETVDKVFENMTSDGIYSTQFNLLSAGIETMPAAIDEEKVIEIERAVKKYNIKICALSGTFNMIDPDIEVRKDGCKRFDLLCQIASRLNIPVVSLCTGSKNPQSK